MLDAWLWTNLCAYVLTCAPLGTWAWTWAMECTTATRWFPEKATSHSNGAFKAREAVSGVTSSPHVLTMQQKGEFRLQTAPAKPGLHWPIWSGMQPGQLQVQRGAYKNISVAVTWPWLATTLVLWGPEGPTSMLRACKAALQLF